MILFVLLMWVMISSLLNPFRWFTPRYYYRPYFYRPMRGYRGFYGPRCGCHNHRF